MEVGLKGDTWTFVNGQLWKLQTMAATEASSGVQFLNSELRQRRMRKDQIEREGGGDDDDSDMPVDQNGSRRSVDRDRSPRGQRVNPEKRKTREFKNEKPTSRGQSQPNGTPAFHPQESQQGNNRDSALPGGSSTDARGGDYDGSGQGSGGGSIKGGRR